MKKGKVSLVPLLFSAAISALLFYVIIRYAFLSFWHFDITSAKHWGHILGKWQKGWVLHTPKEICFVIALFLLIPGYFLFWFIVHCFPLKKILLLPFSFFENRKKEKLKEKSLAAAIGPADRIKAPAAKKGGKKTANRAPSQKMQLINQLRGMGTQQQQSAKAGNPDGNEKATAQPVRNEKLSRFELWENLARDLEKAGVFTARQVKIKGAVFNIVAITKDALFLLGEGPVDAADWETHDTAEPPVWKTAKGDIPSPMVAIAEAKGLLRSYIDGHLPAYSGMSMNCCLILDHGDITNPEGFLAYLEQNDLAALRMGSCNTTVLPESAVFVEYIKALPASTKEMNDALAVAFLELMDVA